MLNNLDGFAYSVVHEQTDFINVSVASTGIDRTFMPCIMTE